MLELGAQIATILAWLAALPQSSQMSCHLQALQTAYALVWGLLGSFVEALIDLPLTRRNLVESLRPKGRVSRARIRSAQHFVHLIFVVSGRV
jgi:uncharacterized membrane protein